MQVMKIKNRTTIKQDIDKRRKRIQLLILIMAAGLVLVVVIASLPPIRVRIVNRLEDFRLWLSYQLDPPTEAVFVPDEQDSMATMVAGTLQAYAPTATSTDTAPKPTSEATPEPTATEVPTPTPYPLPDSIDLRDQVTYVHQHGRWNYCGPANLTMALNFWGWEGDRDMVGKALKPGPDDPDMDFITRTRIDKNVMPYEMVNFVNDQTEFNAFYRYGGDIDLIKKMLANGYPVLVEKGYYEYSQITNSVDWMGHYLFVTGYNEPEGYLIVQDAYLQKDDEFIGKNYQVSYEDFKKEWRYFNYLFIMVYPPTDEAKVYELTGPWLNQDWANRHALDIANQEITELEGLPLFFAWFNKGTSHVQLYEYVDAAFAYDYAFLLYPDLEDNERPWRIMWYQTGPYFAYYYSARYQDVINLANTTLYDQMLSEPTLEESLYWRGMALLAQGETGNAVEDFRQTVYINPNFAPGWQMLNQLGVTP